MSITTTTPPVTTTTTAPTPRRRTGGRAALVVVGALLLFFGVNAVMGAAIMLSFDSRHGDDGFFTARPGRFSTETHAITSASLDLSAAGPDELYSQNLLGQLRITAGSTDARPIFIGIARTDDVAAYLGAVAHEEIDETELGMFGVEYTAKPGGAPPAAPTAQAIWAVSATGPGQQSLTWSVAPGDWTIVLMNADGSAGVSADGTGGITLPVLHTIVASSFVSGGLLLLAGLAMILSARAAGRRQPSR